MFGTFLFDFDYTLIDSSEAIVRCINSALTKNGFDAQDSDKIEATVGLMLYDIFPLLADVKNDKKMIETLTDDFLGEADKIMAPMTKFLPGALETLTLLKEKGYNTGIITSKNSGMVHKVLKPRGYSGLVDLVIGCRDVTNPKPDAEGILKAAKYFGCDKSEILYIGDSVTDAKTAENAGVAFAGVTTGRTSYEKLSEFPYLCIGKSLNEIFGKILN